MQGDAHDDLSPRLVSYTRAFLDRSFDWLGDPETRRLTMTPPFTRDQQLAFFESLPNRPNYHVWGVEIDGGVPIGAAGIKHVKDGAGEYWGYIGDKRYWGRGLGRGIVVAVENEARRLQLSRLYLAVTVENARARALYAKLGFRETRSNDALLEMDKSLLNDPCCKPDA